jgi:phosphatidate cytidylyltransferase
VSVVLAQRPKFRKTETLIPRVLSIIVLVPLSLWIIYIGPPYSLFWGGLLATGIFIEWSILCLKNLLSFWSRLAVTILGTAYVIVAVLWLLHLLAQPEGWKLLYWLLFLVWSTDTTAYIGGRLLKGPKLAPSISPHKTWAGFITGMIGGTIITYITSFWLLPNVFNLWEIIFLVFIAQGGDLLESKAKRWSHVKDSGALIPGHGGLLDRLDSLLAIATTIALWQWFF